MSPAALPPKSQILAVDQRLIGLFGEPRRRRRDPVSQLVITMLSQATTDVQTDRSFAELKRRYPTWEQVRSAPVSQIANAIRSSGLSEQKAPRIKGALQFIARRRGRIELGFLKRMSDPEANRWLMGITGVGPKTAAIVLLFSFKKAFFPVDTHVFRVTKRLGWILKDANPEKTHEILRSAVPPNLHYRLHLNLIRLGREICEARKPKCSKCPLTDLCAYYSGAYGSRQ